MCIRDRYSAEGADLGISSNAVDGNTNTNFYSGSCTHTLSQQSPIWSVDLGNLYKVYIVKITNRGG